jgi:glycosyltransferase involved in cell wall biosynthesis
MPRLLILCEYPTLLGGERSMLATLGTVAAAGFEILVAAPPSGPLAAAICDSSFAAHIPWQTHDDNGTRLPLEQLRSELRNTIAAVRPDLVHANSLSTARIAGPVAADCRIASIGHLRDIVKLAPQAVADLNTHHRLIAVSAATRDYHIAQGLDASRCVVVHNGVDLLQFRPRPRSGYLHQELGLPANARLVAVAGQLGLRKGTDTALAAAALVAAQMPDVHWLIVGERTSQKAESREFEERLRAMTSRPPLAGRVHFVGTRDDMPTLLAECEVLVHAARQEPLGRVLLESAACGLAVIATDVGGTREIFPADEAILVRPDDANQLAGKLAEVLSNSKLQTALQAAARNRSNEAFDIPRAAQRLVEHYRQTLTDPV